MNSSSSQMITLCVLNWNRPENLKEIILPLMARYRRIDEIIISHGRDDVFFDFSSPHVNVINLNDSEEVNKKFGISRRWRMWERARNETVLSLDDDILLSEPQLEKLWESFQRQPFVMHGLADQSRDVPSFMPASAGRKMLLAGCYLVPASLGRECLKQAKKYVSYISEPQRSYPLWDGDYIFSSLMACRVGGDINQAHALPFRWLCVAYPGNNLDHNEYRYNRHRALFQTLTRDWGIPVSNSDEMVKKPSKINWLGLKSRAAQTAIKMVTNLHLSPTFLILGAGRCGTTALFQYLSRHQRMLPPREKELHILNTRCFGSNYERYRYRREFPWRYPWRYQMMTGEATPNLLNSYGVSRQLAAEYPNIRMIVLLRDPIDRIWSMYNFRRHNMSGMPRWSRETRSLEEALEQEWQLLERGVSPDISAKFCLRYYLPDIADQNAMHQAYLIPGLYVRWIKKYFSVFPREQLLILQSDDLFRRPDATLARVHDFLDLPPTTKCNPDRFVRSHQASYQGTMSAETKARLAEYFKQPNAELYDLLGEDYGWQ